MVLPSVACIYIFKIHIYIYIYIFVYRNIREKDRVMTGDY